MSGRPKNENFEKLGFILIKVNNKYAAVCKICKKELQNTAATRLRAHRNVCRERKIPTSEDNSQQSDDDIILLVNMDTEEIGNNVVLSTCKPLELPRHQIQQQCNTSVVNSNNMDISFSSEAEDNENTVHDVATVTAARSLNYSSSLSIIPSSSSSSVLHSSCSSEKCIMDSTTKLTKKKNKLISNYVDQLSANDVSDITSALGNFVFGCNLSFRTMESIHFKNFITKIRPAYVSKIPDRKILSTTLLDKAYRNCIKKAKETMKAKSVLLIDGWKNSSTNSKIVVSMIHNASGGNQAFLDAWDCTGESETAEKLSEIVVESLDKAKDLYSTDVYAIVSDNASTMIKMGRIVKHVVWHTTCNSHIGNLLAKDILNKTLTEQVNSVLKEYKQADFEHLIIEKGGHRIKLPCDTRWCSYRDAYKSLIFNIEYMRILAAEKNCKKVKQNVTKLIFDDEFIEQVKEYIELLDPICNLINICQKSDSSIADAVNLWLNLILPEKYKQQFRENLEMRKKMAFNEYALVAYYFHPFYDNEILTNQQNNTINAFLFKFLDGEGIEEWDSFRNRSGLFQLLYQKEIKKPLVFWNMAGTSYPQLSELAVKLLQIPASTAQLERAFSNWSQIHPPIRNRLSFEKSKKLLHVYYSLRMSESEEMNSDFDFDDNYFQL